MSSEKIYQTIGFKCLLMVMITLQNKSLRKRDTHKVFNHTVWLEGKVDF